MTIKIKNSYNKEILIKSVLDKPLLEILQESEIPIRSDCGGRGVCGKCLLTIKMQDHLTGITPAEKAILSSDDIESGERLACQTRQAYQGDIQVAGCDITEKPEKNVSSKVSIGKHFDVNSILHRRVIIREVISQKKTIENMSLVSYLGKHDEMLHLNFTVQSLRQLSNISRKQEELTIIENDQNILSILPGRHPLSLGIAVDIGTTTLAIYLCDLKTGNILSASARSNSQKIYGEDVITRIDFVCKAESNLKKLQKKVIEDINELIIESVEKAGVSIDDIDDACFVGNPTMQSIVLKFYPSSIGHSPYLPVTNQAVNIKNRDLGLILRDEINLHFLPMPSAFIGGDAMGAAIAIEPPQLNENILIIDLGTNGELLLLTSHGSFATSAATGPAFEGHTISCGVRAIPGAVSGLKWNKAKECFDFTVIPGNPEKKLIGLCGSGLIDAVAEALKANLISLNGRIKRTGTGIHEDNSGRSIDLEASEDNNSKGNLKLTQKDIRQLQLGKAALRVGIDALLDLSSCAHVSKTIFTGAFGANFNWESALSIGMIPGRILEGTIETMNNAAGIGAVKALLNHEYRIKAQSVSQEIQCFDLGKYLDFSNKFAEASMFAPINNF